MTMAEHVLARRSGRSVVRPGEYLWADVDGTALVGSFSKGVAAKLDRLGVSGLWNPDRVYAVEHHMIPAYTPAVADMVVQSCAKT
jgi:homoaconitase/3-isopropylmalate dehydratase large subunit